VELEVTRARQFYQRLDVEKNLKFVHGNSNRGLPGAEQALKAFLEALMGRAESLNDSVGAAKTEISGTRPQMKEQLDQLVNFTQAITRRSPDERRSFWQNADPSSVQSWKKSTQFYRDYIWDEIIGGLPSPTLPINPRSRPILNAPHFTAYEVMLDVWTDVFAYGIFLLPKGDAAG
jgi:hypothetical protein